jgi:hypothetical protein
MIESCSPFVVTMAIDYSKSQPRFVSWGHKQRPKIHTSAISCLPDPERALNDSQFGMRLRGRQLLQRRPGGGAVLAAIAEITASVEKTIGLHAAAGRYRTADRNWRRRPILFSFLPRR